jgi:hypothetical protein
MAQKCVRQAPKRVASQPDRDENQQNLAEGLVRDRLQRATLVSGSSAGADRELDGQDSDDPVDHAAGSEAGAAEHLESRGVLDLVCRRLGMPDGHRPCGTLNTHRRINEGTGSPGTRHVS